MAVPAAHPRDRDRRRNSEGGHWKMCYSRPDSRFAHRRPRPRAYLPAKCETESYSLRISFWFLRVGQRGSCRVQVASTSRRKYNGKTVRRVEKIWLTRIVLLIAKFGQEPRPRQSPVPHHCIRRDFRHL